MTTDAFTTSAIETDETQIFVCSSGVGSPLLLLHGFYNHT